MKNMFTCSRYDRIRSFHYFITLWILLVLNSANPLAGQQDVYMKIRSRGFQPIPILIQPFSSESGTAIAENAQAILISDLEFSGYFRLILDEKLSFLAHAKIEGEVGWLRDSLVFKCRILEMPGRNAMLDRSYFGLETDEERPVHHAANDVILTLTGEQGLALTQIAFVSQRGPAREIMIMNYDGKYPRQITHNDSINLAPAWSQDAGRLIFTSFASGNPDLMIYDMKTKSFRIVNRHRGLHTSPAWAPDGKAIVYAKTVSGNTDLYMMDNNTSRRLTVSAAIDCAPTWSPDGSEIAFVSDRSGSPQVYMMDAQGGNVRRLTHHGSYNDSPTWSPKGDMIAYVTREKYGFQINIMDVSGGNTYSVTREYANHEDPSWSPDGMYLAYASDKTGQWDIYITSWDGKRTRRLTTSGGNISPAWSPMIN